MTGREHFQRKYSSGVGKNWGKSVQGEVEAKNEFFFKFFSCRNKALSVPLAPFLHFSIMAKNLMAKKYGTVSRKIETLAHGVPRVRKPTGAK